MGLRSKVHLLFGELTTLALRMWKIYITVAFWVIYWDSPVYRVIPTMMVEIAYGSQNPKPKATS